MFSDYIELYLKAWKAVKEKREELFERVREYGNVKLTQKRDECSRKLKRVAMKPKS